MKEFIKNQKSYIFKTHYQFSRSMIKSLYNRTDSISTLEPKARNLVPGNIKIIKQ